MSMRTQRSLAAALCAAGAACALTSTTAVASNADAPMSADEVRALASEIIADADGRSSLLASGETAGHNKHFYLASADGNFELKFEGQVQFRYILNFRDNAPGEDAFEPGFQTRRTKLVFTGHIYDPRLTYKVQGAFSRKSGTFKLEDGWVGWKFGNGWSAKWGQFKVPLLHEELVSSKRQLAVERSLTNEFFTGNRSQGVELNYKQDHFRFMGAFTDGLNASNTEIGTEKSDFGLTGRVEWLVAGDWKQFKDFTSRRGSDFGTMIGGAVHFEDGADRPGGPGPNDRKFITYTADVSVKGDGWNLYGAFIGRSLNYDSNALAAEPLAGSRDDFGVVVQGGVFLTDDLEAFARYDELFIDSKEAAQDNLTSLTFGANYYLHGHATKFTVDVTYLLDSTILAGIGSESSLGILGSTNDGEVAVRAQFQLLF